MFLSLFGSCVSKKCVRLCVDGGVKLSGCIFYSCVQRSNMSEMPDARLPVQFFPFNLLP